MGKQVEVNADYEFVLLPDGVAHNDGDVVDLTDVEYAALEDWALTALTLLGDVADPVRAPSGVQTLVVADESDGHFYEIVTDGGGLDTVQVV
jgi:hypothetical protein